MTITFPAVMMAAVAIDARHAESPGSFGKPLGPHKQVGPGQFYRDYAHGSIAHHVGRGKAVAVYGAICQKWRGLGGLEGPLGLPTTDEKPTADGHGRMNAFKGGDIYWRKDLGAFELYGAIRDHWLQMGGVKSQAGYPTSGEVGVPLEIGAERVSHFERASIYWSAKRGVTLAPKSVQFWFTGLQCLDESSESSDSDEPYVSVGLVVPGTKTTAQWNTGVHEVDAGDKVPSAAMLYHGPPRDLVVSVVVMEHDHGSPGALSKEIGGVLKAAAGAAMAATGTAALGTVANAVIDVLSPALSALSGAGDDTVGRHTRVITLLDLAKWSLETDSGDIAHDLSFDLGSDSEGIYRLFFRTAAG